MICGTRCNIPDGAASIGNDNTAELAAGGLVFTKSEDIGMLSKDLFISMKEIRVNIISLERDSGPTALSTKPRSATTETPVYQGAARQAIVKKG